MNTTLNIDANFRTGSKLPSIQAHYTDLWQIAKFLETYRIPLNEWFPPADTEEHSLLNNAFTDRGPSSAALALAVADPDNLATDMRTLGVWNGKEDEGGIAFTAAYNTGYYPSAFNFSSEEVAALQDHQNVVNFVQYIVAMWKPMAIQIAPAGYLEKSVFDDRPGAGWMLYLPFTIDARQVPEAQQVIPIMDASNKKQRGTLLMTVTDTFDLNNPAHVQRANAIETRLVDRDLLPTNREFVENF